MKFIEKLFGKRKSKLEKLEYENRILAQSVKSAIKIGGIDAIEKIKSKIEKLSYEVTIDKKKYKGEEVVELMNETFGVVIEDLARIITEVEESVRTEER